MELIKGRKTRRAIARNEQMYRVAALEELWETACSDEKNEEEREVQNARKRPNFLRPNFPIAS